MGFSTKSTVNVEIFAVIVDFVENLCELRCMRIAYGMNRTRRQFDKLDISSGKYFLDTASTAMEQRLDMLLALRPDDVVVVLSMADLGKGQAQIKAVNTIEATGATIEVVGEPVGKSGRPARVKWPDGALDQALKVWGLLPEKEALAWIKRELKVETDRNHMNHQRRKAAAKLLKKGDGDE